MSLPRCPKKRCRAIMIERPGPFGQLSWVCVPCEVNEAGFCRRCPNKLPPKKDGTNKGRRKYCVPCRQQVEAEQDKRRYWHDEERRAAEIDRQRRRRDDPVIYADMMAKQRARHCPKQPRTDIDRAYGRMHAAKRRRGEPRVTVDRRKKAAA